MLLALYCFDDSAIPVKTTIGSATFSASVDTLHCQKVSRPPQKLLKLEENEFATDENRKIAILFNCSIHLKDFPDSIFGYKHTFC
jgi:hypothetical protein